jgi:hypothetical protein
MYTENGTQWGSSVVEHTPSIGEACVGASEPQKKKVSVHLK